MKIEYKPTKYERKKYVLSDKKDLIILQKIKFLEKKKLCKEDKETLKLIRTQLEKNWRTPLIKYLNKLSKKYRK